MDWTKAIDINRAAIARIVEEISALLELTLLAPNLQLQPLVRKAVRRLLRPAESALRRLIIIVARDVSVTLPPQRVMPKGRAIARRGTGRMRFKLYDTRKRFRPLAETAARDRGGPRIHFFSARGPLIPAAFTHKPAPDSTAQLCRRFAALKDAFENLPREARRMALWRRRRSAKPGVKFTSPLRPGQPPGHQRRPRLAVDHVLAACHGLAFDVLEANSS